MRSRYMIEMIRNFLHLLDFTRDEIKLMQIIRIEPLEERADDIYPSSLVVTFETHRVAHSVIERFCSNRSKYAAYYWNVTNQRYQPSRNVKIFVYDEHEDRHTSVMNLAKMRRVDYYNSKKVQMDTMIQWESGDMALFRFKNNAWEKILLDSLDPKKINHSNESDLDWDRLPTHHKRMRIKFLMKNGKEVPAEALQNTKMGRDKANASKKRPYTSPRGNENKKDKIDDGNDSIMEVTNNQEEDGEPLLGAAGVSKPSTENATLSPLPVLRKTPPSKIPIPKSTEWTLSLIHI